MTTQAEIQCGCCIFVRGATRGRVRLCRWCSVGPEQPMKPKPNYRKKKLPDTDTSEKKP